MFVVSFKVCNRVALSFCCLIAMSVSWAVVKATCRSWVQFWNVLRFLGIAVEWFLGLVLDPVFLKPS